MNQTAEGYQLPCGRDVETVWERLDEVDAGRADAHELDCQHCRAARESLRMLRAVTGLLVTEDDVPSPGLTRRIMSAVRAEARRGEMVALPTAEPGAARVSERAIAAVLRFAADSVPGVRARRCQVRTVSDNAASDDNAAHGLDADIDADEVGIEVAISIAVSYQQFVGGALDLVRERVAAAATGQIGVWLRRIDLTVEDVYQT
jgi:uncharacterized alkaline shock family protein YloU